MSDPLLEFPLERLFERPGLADWGLPAPIVAAYGGALGFAGPAVVANFVSSIDGVVALPVTEESGGIISRHDEADRFVMSVLRACAGAILVGAGTFRKAGSDLWTATSLFPRGSAAFAALRSQLGLAPRPRLAVVTRSGDLDVAQPGLADALVVTTAVGAAKLSSRLPKTARILTFDAGAVPLAQVVATLHSDGARLILSEGGPTLFSQLASERLLDELFLTASPALFGRFPGDGRKSLTNGVDLAGASLDLVSARRHGSHLFLRYALPARRA
jgi:riboflavin biosynthesis pyrimidine reductase